MLDTPQAVRAATDKLDHDGERHAAHRAGLRHWYICRARFGAASATRRRTRPVTSSRRYASGSSISVNLRLAITGLEVLIAYAGEG
jgi:hypothetical protein